MTRDELALFIDQIEIRRAKWGRRLIELGSSDKKTLFLIHGSVQVEDSEGKTQLIDDNSIAARHPISFQDPHQYTVTCKSTVEYLRIDNFVINNLLDKERVHKKNRQTVDDDIATVEQQLYNKINQDLMRDKLVIPTLPKIAVSVRHAIENDMDLRKVEILIQADPAMASMLIKAANSALYRTKHSVKTIQQAIIRMGLKTLKFLVTSYTIRGLFVTRSHYCKKKMQKLWAHSIDVAAVAFVLATKVRGFDPEHALLLGLLHDIGAVPIISYTEKFPELMDDPDALDAIIEKLRAQIGALVLKQWNFSDDFITVAQEVDNWFRDNAEHADYSDLILVAHHHSFIGTKLAHTLPPLYELPAFKKLGLSNNTPESGLEILVNAKEQILQARQLLSA